MSSLENVVSIQLPAGDLETAIQKLVEVYALLKPHLIELTPQERRVMPKMGIGNTPFVEKALEYAKTKPELGPAFLDVNELDIDVKSVNDLASVARIATRLCSGLDDTIMMAGSEAYVASLAYYHSVKAAAKMNIKGAQPVYKDLKQRFNGQGRRSEKPDTSL